MKRSLAILLSSVMVLGLLAGCSPKEEKEEATPVEEASGEDETAKEETADPVTISVWHDGNDAIMEVIQAQLNEKLSGDNISVNFEKKTGLTDQIKLYGNDAENGPDMYMYAHDSLGTFVEMGVLSPITDIIEESVYDDMLPMTVKAGSYKDEQYLMPIYFETLLFMYNKDLWQGDLPKTTEDLYAYMEANTDVDAGTYAVVNQHSTAYNVSPFIYGFDGFIIDESGVPGLNNEKTKEAIEYNEKFAALQADGDYNTVGTLFNEGKAQAIIGGPWLISGINDAGINLGISSLADFTLPNGEGLAPFSGVQGIGVMKYAAEDKKDALGKVLTELTNPELGIELAKEANCAPANASAYDDSAVMENEMIAAMKTTAETAQPMPNIPQMSVMWGPAEGLLAAVNKSGEDVNDVADQYQKDAETAIADMQ